MPNKAIPKNEASRFHTEDTIRGKPKANAVAKAKASETGTADPNKTSKKKRSKKHGRSHSL